MACWSGVATTKFVTLRSRYSGPARPLAVSCVGALGLERVLHHTPRRLFLMKVHRLKFVEQQTAVRKIQSVARGYIGREHVRRLRTLQSIADELWRLQKVREREYVELTHLASDALAVRRSHAAFSSSAKRSTLSEFKVRGCPVIPFCVQCACLLACAVGVTLDVVPQLLDVDVIMDNSDVYTRGWTQLYAELQADLAPTGNRCVAVAPGATHTVVLTESGAVYSWGWGDRCVIRCCCCLHSPASSHRRGLHPGTQRPVWTRRVCWRAQATAD